MWTFTPLLAILQPRMYIHDCVQECSAPGTCANFTATYNGIGFGPYAPGCTTDGSWPKSAPASF